MKALGTCLCAILAIVATGPCARADEASKQTKIEELFNVMHMEQMLPQVMQQTMAQMKAMLAAQSQKMNLPPEAAPKLEEIQTKVMALVAERTSWRNMRPVYVKIYADTFTEEEIGGISDFYRSPAGQALLKKTPLLTQNIMHSMQGLMGDMFAEIPRMLDESFRQHPPSRQ